MDVENIKKVSEDRVKKLTDLKANLNKSYGKGSFMDLDGDNVVQIPATSSGSIKLDNAIGIGGYPKGRIIEIYGPESSGKCLVGSTYINTASGLKTIEEVFIDNNVVPSCTTKVSERNILLFNEHKDLEQTTHFTNNGRRKTYTVTTGTGKAIQGTANHPLRVMSKNGYLIWKQIKDLEVGDYLVTARDTEFKFFGSNTLDVDEAYLLGCLTADGSFQRARIEITNDDPSIKSVIEEKLSSIFDLASLKSYPNNDKFSVTYHSNSLEKVTNFYEKYGLSAGYARDKCVPKLVRESDKETVASFLRGYFDCESFCDGKNYITVTSASKKLLTEVQLLLEMFGIISYVHKKSVQAYPDTDYYRLAIYQDNLRIFTDEIGTRSTKVEQRYNNMVIAREDLQANTNKDSVPHIKNMVVDLYRNLETVREDSKIFSDYIKKDISVSYTKLKKIIEYNDSSLLMQHLRNLNHQHYYYDEIVSIEYSGEVPTFDFAMSKTHSFIANGFLSHNTTMALHAIVEVQKIGGGVAFIDVEQALDVGYAKNLGVSTGDLLFAQPDSAEEALNMVQDITESGAVDLIVVDSVAALTPLKELDGEMGDTHVGLHARLMSQACRKLRGLANKTGTTIIFINQIRMKIGVMFGNPETVTGGNALKFYSSVRMDVRRKGTNSKGDEALSNTTKVKIVKNKVAPPYKVIEFDIIFGEGIDKLGEIITLATEFGFIQKSGAWYSIGEERLGQGKDNVKLYLKENPEVAKDLEQKVREKLAES